MRTTLPRTLLLTAILSWTANSVQAQTYFYMDQIAVVPAAPTDQDNVQLQLSGDLSSTGASITSATAQVTGFTVALSVNATSEMGLDVLVPHTEVVNVGVIPAGNYTITMAGSGIEDLAPQGQHHFTVTGGAPSVCDSLTLAGLTWAPFSDTALLVHVFNPTATLFDYPGFVLLADNGDTLAKETVNFFGIGQESFHILSIPQGTTMPPSPFNGTLQLWTLFYQTLSCSWDLPVDLCPPDSCSEVFANLQNLGSGLATGDFQYAIREQGAEVASGTFTLTEDHQYDQDTLCLPPGNYLMEIIPQQGPNGGQPHFGVSVGNAIPGPGAPVIWTTLSAVGFTFYENCIDIGQGIATPAQTTLSVARSANGIEVMRNDGHALGDMQVFDAQGRMIVGAKEATGRHGFVTTGWAPGIYILRSVGKDGNRLTARWVVE